jgi:hypothetical protein
LYCTTGPRGHKGYIMNKRMELGLHIINRTDGIGKDKEYILEYQNQEDRWDDTGSSRKTGLNRAKKTDMISQDQQDIRNLKGSRGQILGKINRTNGFRHDQQDRRE